MQFFVSLSLLAGGDIQWNYIHGLFDQAVYGGRVDNPVDTDVLRSYLIQYFNGAIIGGSKGLKSRLASNINLPNSTELHVILLIIDGKERDNIISSRIIKRSVMNFLMIKRHRVSLVFQLILNVQHNE